MRSARCSSSVPTQRQSAPIRSRTRLPCITQCGRVIDAVRVLVEAADLTRPDTIYGGTPLDWAEHCRGEEMVASRAQRYDDIVAYLQSR